jgi:hypothetical protein
MSNTFRMHGRVTLVKDESVSRAGFRTREIVVTDDDPRYPSVVAVTFTRDGCDRLNEFDAGDMVEIEFWIAGREWNGRHYVELRGIDIRKAEGESR